MNDDLTSGPEPYSLGTHQADLGSDPLASRNRLDALAVVVEYR